MFKLQQDGDDANTPTSYDIGDYVYDAQEDIEPPADKSCNEDEPEEDFQYSYVDEHQIPPVGKCYL